MESREFFFFFDVEKRTSLEVDGLLVSLLDVELAAVARVLRRVAESVVVSVMEEGLAVRSR